MKFSQQIIIFLIIVNLKHEEKNKIENEWGQMKDWVGCRNKVRYYFCSFWQFMFPMNKILFFFP